MNNLIKQYKIGIQFFKDADDSWEIVLGYSYRDDIQTNWDKLTEKEKEEVKQLDQEMISVLEGKWGHDYRNVAANEGYNIKTHWWYWLAAEPLEAKKYAKMAY